VLAAATLLYARTIDSAPNYDEGVYLASADALGRGEELGSDVFASQPPGFYLLLRLATALPGESVSATRVLFLAIAVGGIAAAWALGRALAGPAGGLGAAAALTVASAYANQSTRIAADVPSIALALAGLALLAWAVKEDSAGLAAAAGVTLAASLSVKLLAVTALVAAVAMLATSGSPRRLLVATVGGAAAVLAALLAVHAGEIGQLYDDVVAFHTDARGAGDTIGENTSRVVHTFEAKAALTWIVAAGVLVWIARRGRPRLLVSLWLWAVAAIAFLIWQRPLLDHHFVLFAAALALPAGSALGNAAALSSRTRLTGAVAAIILLPAYAQQWHRVGQLPNPEPDAEAAADYVAQATRPSETIVSDVPLIAYLADRPLPGELVDTSAVRFAAGSLDADCVLSAADAAGVRVVVVGRMFRADERLVTTIRERFPRRHQVGEITVYERPRAAARAAQAAAPGSCSGPRASR
jgi:4-amino-4-deoxy-L-arabinose transferase-like glycosyltransferase